MESLGSEPAKINMGTVPVLLAENGNYTSLADLTLRKIKALSAMQGNKRVKSMNDEEINE